MILILKQKIYGLCVISLLSVQICFMVLAHLST